MRACYLGNPLDGNQSPPSICTLITALNTVIFINKFLQVCCLAAAVCFWNWNTEAEPVHAGPWYDEFDLTLTPGKRKEFFGPLYYSEQRDTLKQWAISPLTLAHTEDPTLQYSEYDFLYPFLTYDRFGAEYRWHIFQLFSFAGGQNPDDSKDRRFTLFPIYFQQRSDDPTHNYTAVGPFFGELKHRLFRDQIDYVMFPGYSRTVKKDVVTYNAPYPFFSLRHGDHLEGWKIWPLTGHEHKDLTWRTNNFGDVEPIGGHDSRFVIWPFFTTALNDTGTTNASKQQALIPFYSFFRSKLRNSTSVLWPLGVTHTVDTEHKYDEWDAPWPLIEFARGEGKDLNRVWPFFSRGHNRSLTDNWYLWPIYKYNRIKNPPLDRERTRILFFLYSVVNERNAETQKALRRVDFFPFFTHRQDYEGRERWQFLSIMEPFFPNNKSIERDYSQLWSLWRAEKNPQTGAASQSLLWNLYRRETAPQSKKISLIFGLFQYQSTAADRHWRLFYIPMGAKTPPAAKPAAR